jgi:hypothetical protein
VDRERNRNYKIADGDLPFFMHRERGLHLDEPDVTVDGKPINAALLGTAFTLFYAGRAQADRGQGIYFYLPKLEAAAEARWYRDLFDLSQRQLPFLARATIRAVVLVESLPCVYEMEGMLYELGPYAAGLNAARWDLKASIFEFVMTDPAQVWPDRFGVDIKTTPFLSNIFRRLVAISLKRGAVPIGGMATALPSQDPEVNRAAAEAIRGDKQWEAEQGFIRGWVAHIFHMKTAGDPFKKLIGSGWKPTEQMANPDNYPVAIKAPEGPITVEGTRRNARMLIEYVEGWLGGRGAKGIDSLEGKPGIHPALMEDLATGRMSVAHRAADHPQNARDRNRYAARLRAGQAPAQRRARRHPHPTPGRRDSRALSQGVEDRDALDQELHRAELQEPRRLHARRARRDRRRARRVLSHVSRTIWVTALSLVLLAGACAGRRRRSACRTSSKPAMTESLSMIVRAQGVQITNAGQEGSSRGYEWAFVAPEADLFDARGNKTR